MFPLPGMHNPQPNLHLPSGLRLGITYSRNWVPTLPQAGLGSFIIPGTPVQSIKVGSSYPLALHQELFIHSII